jgi:hypothetical protein
VTVAWLIRQTRAEARGLCVRCGGELDEEGGCAECRQDYREQKADAREQRVEEGWCRCGRHRAADRQQCEPCLAADREYKRARRAEVQRVEQGMMDRGRTNQGERT